MSIIQFIQVTLCVVMVATGQLLFALGAKSTLLTDGKGIITYINKYLVVGLIVYAIATVIWIYLLRNIPISIAYPFMSLSFIIVPIASYYVFGDPLNVKILIGGAFIMLGVYLVAS